MGNRIDIAIALTKSKTNWPELRYTLRSIEANLTGYGDIYIIGEKPSWLYNVIHIPYTDIFNRKAFSIYRKFKKMAECSQNGNFIRWDDDIYLMEKLDVSDIKAWHEGGLEEWTKKNTAPGYGTIIKRTHGIFPEGLYFDIHTPCIYEKEKYLNLPYEWSSMELLNKSIYHNHHGIKGEFMIDPKKQKGLFYSSGSILKNSEIQMLKKLFPNPSKYESYHKANSQTGFGVAETTG